MNKSLFTLVCMLTALVASPVLAAELDFTDPAFAGANYQKSFNYTADDGVKLTVTAGGSSYAKLYQDSEDGFGVRLSYETDEIEECESLTLSFSESVLLTDVYITDLFIESDSRGYPYAEVGFYGANGDKVQFEAVQGAGTNGELTLNPDIWVQSIVFTAPGERWVRHGYRKYAEQNHEFSVAGLKYSRNTTASVPELDPGAAGSALILVFGAVLMLCDRQRRSRPV